MIKQAVHGARQLACKGASSFGSISLYSRANRTKCLADVFRCFCMPRSHTWRKWQW